MTEEISIDISLKEDYLPLYEKPAMYNDLWGGRGRGGSHEATLYALYRWTKPDYCRIAFIRKILADVRHSLWKDFKDRMTESNVDNDDYNLADAAMTATYLPTGNTVNCFGVKAEGGRTAKLKSLAGYNLVIIEECDELTEEEFNQIDDSLRTVKGDEPPMIIRVFNPPGRFHWIWNNYNLIESEVDGYWRASPKTGVNILSIFGTHDDNITNITPNKIEKWRGYKTSNPEYYYTIIRGLISEGQRGRILHGWLPITQEVFKQVDARSIYGLDFGWSESPMAFGELKLVKNKVYGREHIYKPMSLKELGIEMCKLGITGSDIIVADSEDPISINKLRSGWTREELTEYEIENYPQLLEGFYVIGAIKGPGTINYGLSMMADFEFFICEDSLNYWDEYRNYKWALDKDKNPTNVPEDKKNHHIDWTRYIITGKDRIF